MRLRASGSRRCASMDATRSDCATWRRHAPRVIVCINQSPAKCRFEKARPEPDFKYFANPRAVFSVVNSIETMIDQGLYRTV